MKIPSIFCLAFVTSMSGCGTFFPPFGEETGSTFDKGMTQYSEIVAATELGDYSSRGTYSAAAPKYAASLGAFNSAKMAVAAAPATGPAAEAKVKIVEQIENCVTGLTLMAEIHKTAGLKGGAANYKTGLETCAIAGNSLN